MNADLVCDQARLLNDAQLWVWYSKKEQLSCLNSEFDTQKPIVVTTVCEMRLEDSKYSEGKLCSLQTMLYIVHPPTPVLDPNKLVKVRGPTFKIPQCYISAAFGVDESTTADLIFRHVMPYSNALLVPKDSKLNRLKSEEEDYTQFVYIKAPSQITFDVFGTFCNVGLRLPRAYVKTMYNGGGWSTPVSTAGNKLTEALAGSKTTLPVQATISNAGGVASLRETAVPLDDKTLAFYAIVPNGVTNVVTAFGNAKCGVDAKVGSAALDGYLKTLEPALSAREALDAGIIGIFAIRVKKVAPVAVKLPDEDAEGNEEKDD